MATSVKQPALMTRGRLITGTILLCAAVGVNATETAQNPPAITFKAGVDVVRIAAVVRDQKGRFVQDLTARDFEVLDSGQPRRIADFRSDVTGVSVAVLFDVSGSMEGQLQRAREAATHVLGWLDATRDEAAVFTFDTRLDEATPFTTGLKTLPDKMSSVVPFGATSLHDAIAQTARRVDERIAERIAEREGRRRAVVVFTDGADNASRLRPEDVSTVASGIDVPVYIFGIVPSIDNPSEDVATISAARAALAGPLADLAARSGGHVFMASTPAQRSVAARQIVDELRHQYLIAFESSGKPGWHPLVVRARKKDLVVRARSGYLGAPQRGCRAGDPIAGQSRLDAHQEDRSCCGNSL